MVKKHNRVFILLMIVSLFFLYGCSVPFQKDHVDTEEYAPTGFIKSDIGYYDSMDTAIVMAKDEANEKITFLNLKVNRNYTLKYDGATEIKGRHEEAMSLAQIDPGEIMDITFVKQSKRLNSMQIAKNSWNNSDIEKYSLGKNNKIMLIGEDEYKLYDHVPVFSNGQQGELMDLNSMDVLSVHGIDHTIYSIVVDKGHGYLRLSNDQYFIGGWIEVGQKVIQPITEGMLVVVPEGTYQVSLTNTRIQGTKEVSIERDGEVTLDVGDIEPEEVKYGTLIFSITPDNATLYIDGNNEDSSKPLSLEYGIHQMIVKADGYKTLTQYIKVGQEKATIQVEMEKKSDSGKDEEDSSVSENNSMIEGNTMSSNNTVTTPITHTADSSSNKVYIDSPAGAELYLDSNYIGIVPIAFSKSPGTHIVTLRKNGCQTKSYTLQIDSEAKDITYSFADLISSVAKE